MRLCNVFFIGVFLSVLVLTGCSEKVEVNIPEYPNAVEDQEVKAEIEKLGCFAAEFNTIAIDDGIAMGHDGMLYSLPSRDLIADSVEYMINAHKVDAMVCISNRPATTFTKSVQKETRTGVRVSFIA